MNLDRFRKPGPIFNVADFQAEVAFKTASSVGFRLGRFSKKGGTIFGDLQVHHPCEGHIKAFLFVHLPIRYSKALVELKNFAFRELAIPDDETYELYSCYSEVTEIMGQFVNRDGISDRV